MRWWFPFVALVLFATTPMVSAASSSPTDGQIYDVIERVVAEEAGSDTLCAVSRIDLDGDGGEEAVFTFMVGSHGSQVRAVTWKGGKERILFTGGSNTPNTGFVRIERVPAIVLERSDYDPNYVEGARTQELYLWNGSAFTHNPQDDCHLKRETKEENGQTYVMDSDEHCLPKREPIINTSCMALEKHPK